MLHEILLSLSGHRSPLLRYPGDGTAGPGPTSNGHADTKLDSTLSPPERALLSSLARLSDLHIRLRAHSARIASRHPSVVCRAVGAAIESVHLAAFQRAVLNAEATVLRRDPGLVGAYDIVSLTAVVGTFADWPRRFEWLWELAQFMLPHVQESSGVQKLPSGAQLIDRLRSELQTGYEDIEATARSLVRVAETAWLKQVSAWILFGRLPSFGGQDFFVRQQQQPQTEELSSAYVCVPKNLPSFVTPATASSMLFIGRSLVHMRAKDPSRSGHFEASAAAGSTDQLSSQLHELTKLTYPLESAAFSRTITRIRAVLSRTTLLKLLPLSKVMDMLQLLRDFFLLGRGEFAMALVEQADEIMHSRWQRVDQLVSSAPTTASGVRNINAVMVKDGEVAAVLARTWATMGAVQSRYANADEEEEDEGLELARDVLRLVLQKSPDARPPSQSGPAIASTPFRNLLFSLPASLTLQIPYPLDLVFSPTDLQAYAAIHAYLLSIRRAHIRLTGLWKLASLRRHHPPPPAPPYASDGNGNGRKSTTNLAQVKMLRERFTLRANALRSVWATSSAAIFFLAELEGYLQMDVVVELWEGFQQWLTTGKDEPRRDGNRMPDKKSDDDGIDNENDDDNDDDDANEDIWMAEGLQELPKIHTAQIDTQNTHDPQSLATAHRKYLRRLVRHLLLDQGTFTDVLYALLVAMDQLAALVHRLHALWASLDLEVDSGVVDAFVDLDQEQYDVLDALAEAELGVRRGVDTVVASLRNLEGDDDDDDDDDGANEDDIVGDHGNDGQSAEDERSLGLRPTGAYVPRRVGGLDRLLMKLDFGSWAVNENAAGLHKQLHDI